VTNVAHLTRQSDTSSAVAFLKQLDPDGYHALCAIHPDTRQVEGRVFKPGEWEAMADWIEARQGERNLYYSVNEPDPSAPFSKLKKAHIAKIRAVYADVDPKGEDGNPGGLDAERRRIRAMMDSLLSHPLHSPTAVVDSGGGMQAIWALSEKLPVADWANWAEALGRGIARKIGGDAVQNIERVMRLPGTVNLPDAGKRKKGRKSSIAELIEFNRELHSPAHLEAFAPPISSADTTDQTPQIKIVADALDMDLIRDVCGYTELDPDLRDRFDAHLAQDDLLRRIWDGDTEALPGDDITGSGFRAALARELRPRGYSPTDYGRLLWVWDHSTQEDRDTKLTRRTIARDWVRMGKMPAEEEFDPAPIIDRRTGEPAEQPKPKPRLHYVRFEESAALALIEGNKPLIKGLLDCGAMSVLYGASNVGKTFVALDLAFHVAAGLPWRGRSVTKAAVVYVAAEAGRGIHRRVAALRQHYAAEIAALEARGESVTLSIVPCPIDLRDDKGDTEALIGLIKAAAAAMGAEPGLVFIDTLSRAIAGGDENSSVDMGAFVKHADRLRGATKAHTSVVHHSGKDTSKGARGHSLLRAAADTEIEIADGRIEVTKQREMEGGQVIGFRLKEVILGADPDGDIITSCVLAERVVDDDGLPALTEEEKQWDELLMKGLEKMSEERGVIISKCEFGHEFLRTLWHGVVNLGKTPGSVSKQVISKRMRQLSTKGRYKKTSKTQWVRIVSTVSTSVN